MKRKDWSECIGNIYNENILVNGFYYKKTGKRNRVVLQCKCLLCGNNFETSSDQVFRNDKRAVKQCGCILKKFCSELGKKHGKEHIKLAYSNHYKKWKNPTRKDNKALPIYQTYRCMISRCYNEKDICYKNYGLREIKVYDSWLDYDNFYNWAMDNGYFDGCEQHRLNNNLGYFPENIVFLSDRQHNYITQYMRKNHLDSMTKEDLIEVLNQNNLG